MYKTVRDASEFLQGFLPHLEDTPENRDVVLCIPATSLWVVSKSLHGSRIRLGAQNVHWADEGAFTGEIAPSMLTEIGVRYVVVGHSERRQYFGETDATVNQRLIAAQKAGLKPILCVGETKAQRDAGEAENIIISQLQQGLAGVDLTQLVIAYEPIWAIGTGDTCEVREADRVVGIIRSQLTNGTTSQLSNPDVPILYGGSVKATLIDEIMAQPEIDGVLVGGASLNPEEFARIVNYV